MISNGVKKTSGMDIEANGAGLVNNGVRLSKTSFEMSEFSRITNKRTSEIHEIIREGKTDAFEQMISRTKKSKDLNVLDESGMAPLHHATRYNRVEAIASLLKHGAKVDITTRDERNTPLHIAARFGWEEVTRILVQHSASPKSPNVYGTTPLHFACRRGNRRVVTLLLAAPKNLDIEARDKSLMTALHVACVQGDEEICQMLLDKGANYENEAIDNTTPLHSAVIAGNQAAARVILDKALTQNSNLDTFAHARDVDGNTVLHLCAATNNQEVARILLSHGADVNSCKSNSTAPLHVACTKGHVGMVKLLTENGADLGLKNYEGKTPLHMAASLGSVEVMKYLLSRPISIEEHDFSNRTPFLSAVIAGRTDNALLLLANGADILACDAQMRNCVHLAVQEENLTTLTSLLEQERSDVNLYSPDVMERVPLHYAAETADNKILQALLRKQKRFGFQDECQRTPLHLASSAGRTLHVEALTQAGMPIDERDEEGRTALHVAASHGNRKVVNRLVIHGADVSARDSNRWTPLMCTANAGSIKTCRGLLENGASVDDVNVTGDTPLLIAASRNHVTFVLALLDYGACVTHRNNSGHGIIDVSVKWGAMDVILAICDHPRWREILEDKGPEGHSTMKQLIQHCPDAAKLVMDKCILTPPQMNKKDPDYTITYDFTVLDPGPDDPAALAGRRYFGPLTMVQFNRQYLLLHQLTQRLLDKKWTAFGKTIYYISFSIYLLFVTFFSYFVVMERGQVNFQDPRKQNSTFKPHTFFAMQTSEVGVAMQFIVLVFAAVQIFKEILQIIIQRGRYFTQATNILEWLLYGTSLVFIVPYVAADSWVDNNYAQLKNPFNLWMLAIIAVFLSYVNLVLFLRRFRVIGIYVSMFLEVLRSVLKVMIVFSVFILAFAIVFYILFKEQRAYRGVGESFMKVFVMMTGELDFVNDFVSTINQDDEKTKNPLNPFPEVAFTFCGLLLTILTISVMNLLVGIAVGDIETIQRNATLNRLAMQVEFVAEIETKYPRFISRMSYNPKITDKPNSTTFLSRVHRMWSDYNSLSQPNELNEQTTTKTDPITDMNIKLDKTRKRLKVLVSAVEAQGRLLRTMAGKLDPNLDLMHLADDIVIPEVNGSDHVDAMPPTDITTQETHDDGAGSEPIDSEHVTATL